MSNTKYKPRPYFNAIAGEELYNEDVEAAKLKDKQNSDDLESDLPGQADTQNKGQKTTSEEVDYEKRYWDLKKYHDQLVPSLRREVKEAHESSSMPFTPPKTAEDLEHFRQQNPEFYDVMLSLAYQQVSKSDDQVLEMRRKLEEMEQEKALAQIGKAHPDFETIVKDPQFQQWLNAQDYTIQSWVKENHNNANTFIRAIDLYKLDAGITKKMPKRASDNKMADTSAALDVSVSGNSSVSVGESNQRTWSRAEIDKMSADDFEKYEEEIMAAMMAGRIK